MYKPLNSFSLQKLLFGQFKFMPGLSCSFCVAFCWFAEITLDSLDDFIRRVDDLVRKGLCSHPVTVLRVHVIFSKSMLTSNDFYQVIGLEVVEGQHHAV